MQIYMYLDGELTQEERVQVSRHLADCSPCDHAFGFEAELKALVSRCCCEPVPAGLRERIASAGLDPAGPSPWGDPEPWGS